MSVPSASSDSEKLPGGVSAQGLSGDVAPGVRATEALLKEYEERCRIVVDDSPQGILIHQDRKLVYVNTALADMFGYSPAELLGRDHFETLIAPEDHPLMLLRAEAFYRGEKLAPVAGFRGLRKDGSLVWLMANASRTTWQGRHAIIGYYTDITEMRKTELALRESEARFRTLVEHAPEAIVVLDFDAGIFTDVNDNACQLFGMPREELLRHGPLELSPPTQPDGSPSLIKGRTLIEQAIAGKVIRFEWVHRNAGGTDIACEVRLVRLPSESRRLLRGSILNISERKRREHRERMQRDILERMAKKQPLAGILEAIVTMVELDSPGALCSILLIDEEGRRLLHGAAPRLPDFYNQAVNGLEIGPGVGCCGAAAYSRQRVVAEDLLTHPNWAEYRPLVEMVGIRSCWSDPIFSSTGGLLGTFAIYHRYPCSPTAEELEAISLATHLASVAIEQRRAEESLRISEERLRLAAEAARFGSYDRDLKTNVRIWSPSLREVFGFTLEEPINEEKIYAKIHPDDRERARTALQASFDPAGEGEFNLEHRVLHNDGSIHWVDIRGRTVFEGVGAERRAVRALGVTMDITARKREEDERRKLETQLQHARRLESLGLMAGGVAHDFNNLLTSVLGFSDLARQALPIESPVRGYLDEVVKGARQASELTQRMLAYSGRGRFMVQPLSLSNIVEDMARLLEISVSRKCVLEYSLPHDLPSCEADASQLRQVIMNLVINASEAIGDQNGVIGIRTGRQFCDRRFLSEDFQDGNLLEGEYVYLEVADTGEGMTEETRVKIFDPFFTTKFTGRGLGLAAVLGIVRGHRGTIRIQSDLGVGTTFRVLLPASNLLPVSETPAPVAPNIDWHGTGYVLVVDDEETVRVLARAMLQKMGFTVVSAENGRDGVNRFCEFKDRIRLVLLDMTMPHLDGEETFRELQAIRPDVRTILSSGYDEQQVTVGFSGKGLAGFIQKPYRYETLREVVRKALKE